MGLIIEILLEYYNTSNEVSGSREKASTQKKGLPEIKHFRKSLTIIFYDQPKSYPDALPVNRSTHL